jgi:hypothetical protein
MGYHIEMCKNGTIRLQPFTTHADIVYCVHRPRIIVRTVPLTSSACQAAETSQFSKCAATALRPQNARTMVGCDYTGAQLDGLDLAGLNFAQARHI